MGITLQKDSESQRKRQVGGKPIPTSFLKIEERATLVGTNDQREREDS